MNERGFFPFAKETEKTFFQRISQEPFSAKEFFKKEGELPPFSLKRKVPVEDWAFSLAKLQKSYQIKPCHLEAYYAKKGLRFWHPAMTWVFEGIKTHRDFPLIQLHPNRLADEILSHEAVHLVRAPLKSEKYEEFFAYSLSNQFLRKCFGPLFSSEKDASFWIWSLLGNVFSQLFFPEKIADLVLFLSLLFFIRKMSSLFFRKMQLKKAEKMAKILLENPTEAKAFLFRLTDEEIDFFAEKSSDKVKDFILKNTKEKLRWRLIKASYAFKGNYHG